MKKNINEAEWKVRVDLAAMFRLTHMLGWDDTVWNHITARTPGTDHTLKEAIKKGKKVVVIS